MTMAPTQEPSRRRGRTARVTVGLLLCIVALLPARATAGEFEAPFGFSLADGIFAGAITAGPDGAVWFFGSDVDGYRNVVGKVTAAGEITEYPLPHGHAPYAGPASIVAGPEGDLWFVEWAANAIGRVTPDGQTSSFPLSQGTRPSAITLGSDGNFWFTEGAASRIGRITPQGAITEFALRPGSRPSDITSGPDGDLWFTERGSNKIGRITAAGRIREFPVPGPAARLDGIAAGADGDIWFTEEAFARIGRITPRGKVTQVPVPTATGTRSIVASPDGRLYFISGSGEVAAVDQAGHILWPACLTSSCATVGADALGVGPEGALWASSGVESCSQCGGGGAIELTLRPGGIGPYELPALRLGIGPRATRIVRRHTTLLLACGLPNGCRGKVRLGRLVSGPGDKRSFENWATGRYELAQGESRRVSLTVSRRTVRHLERTAGTDYAVAVAGPPGSPQTKRGPIALRLGDSS